MTRLLGLALFGFALVSGSASAVEMKGVVKKIDAGKNTITLTVDGKDKVLEVMKDASFTSVSTVPNPKKPAKTTEQVENLKDGLAGVKEGAKVTINTDEKEKVTAVKVEGGTSTAKPKDKAAKKAAKAAKAAK